MSPKNISYSFTLDNNHFPLPLRVEWIDGKLWKLTAPFEYHRDNGEIIRAEKDFITDFGSKPWFTWFLVGSPTDEAGPGYIIHDFTYKYRLFPRKICDKIFLEIMIILGIGWWKRGTIYNFVRWFGWIPWKKYEAFLILLCCILCGCSTTATRKDDGTLMIKGIGSAKWPDGAEIKGEPMIKFPQLPSTIIGK